MRADQHIPEKLYELLVKDLISVPFSMSSSVIFSISSRFLLSGRLKSGDESKVGYPQEVLTSASLISEENDEIWSES
jgi:hypothetical protein